jgi:hypothetical protein
MSEITEKQFLFYWKFKDYDKIELKGFKNLNKDHETFLDNFYKEYNHLYETWLDGEKICGTGYNRSLEEVFAIARNYFPEITVDEFLETVIKLAKIPHEGKIGYFFYCSDINHIVRNSFSSPYLSDPVCLRGCSDRVYNNLGERHTPATEKFIEIVKANLPDDLK